MGLGFADLRFVHRSAKVWRRWELSRPRAYELCAASDVVAGLSAIADIRTLPENQAQARPLNLALPPLLCRPSARSPALGVKGIGT
jgi:hypothetical protein